jgi:cell division transport system permease protein
MKKKFIFKVQTVSVYISTTLVLLLLGTMGILFIGARSVSKDIQQSLTLSIVMKNGVEESEIMKFKTIIDSRDYVQESTYISREQALEEEKKALNADPTEMLGYNPYEASIEVTLKPEHSNSKTYEQIEKEFRARKEVKDVIYQKELMDAINSNLRHAGIVLLALFAMLALISWSLIGNLVRLSIYSKRFLLHTMKLVGATWGFIRRPFIASNLWIGFFSGILANCILAAALYFLQQNEPSIMAMLPMQQLAMVAGVVILFGMTICALCAFLSVNRFLRMRSNDLYFI